MKIFIMMFFTILFCISCFSESIYRQIIVWNACRVIRDSAGGIQIEQDGSTVFLRVRESKSKESVNQPQIISGEVLVWTVGRDYDYSDLSAGRTSTAIENIEDRMLYVFDAQGKPIAKYELDEER